MGRVADGLKAGLPSAIICGAAVVSVVYMVLLFMKEWFISIMSSFPGDPVAQQIYDAVLLSGPIRILAGSILFGLLFGVVYGLGYEKLPGRNPISKGLFFGVVLWLLFMVVPLLFLAYSLTTCILASQNIVLNLAGIAISFVFAQLFGALLGFFYKRISPLTLTSPKSPSELERKGFSPNLAMLVLIILGSLFGCLLPWLTANVIIDNVNYSTSNYGYDYILITSARYTAPIGFLNVAGFVLSLYSLGKPTRRTLLTGLAGILIIAGAIGSCAYSFGSILVNRSRASSWSIRGWPEYGLGIELICGFLLIIFGASQE